MKTKYITKNMGEVTIIDLGFSISIWGKYYSMDTQLAHIQLLDFDQNKGFIMNVVNQYDKIYERTKKVIIHDTKFREVIRDHFINHHSNRFNTENILKIFNIETVDEFDLKKIIKNLECPCLYFEGGIEDKIKNFGAQYWFSDEFFWYSIL
jgi:hypothetical protein